MESNPYAPPKASVADAKLAGPIEVPAIALVYSVNQIATATLLGTVLAGGWMMAANYRAMGQDDHSRRAIGWSIAGSIVLLGVMAATARGLVGLRRDDCFRGCRRSRAARIV